MEGIELADAISVVREELIKAQTAGAESNLAFTLGQIDIEFEVALERDVKADGRVKVWVIEIGVGGGLSHRTTHKVTVGLTPHDRTTGAQWEVKDKLSGESH